LSYAAFLPSRVTRLLRSHVSRGAGDLDSLCFLFDRDGKAKIGNADTPMPVEHDVGGFEIPILLHAKPEICTHSCYLGEPEGCVRSHTSLPSGYLVQAGKRNPKTHGKSGLVNLQRFKKLLEQHLARVCRRDFSRQSAYYDRTRPHPPTDGSL